MTQNTTVGKMRRIKLTRDVEMSTGYRGRGKKSLTHLFPKGTEVSYRWWKFNGKFVAHDGEPVDSIHHMAVALHNGEVYSSLIIEEL